MDLIKEYGTLENIYDNIALITAKIREKLAQQKEKAFFSRELSEIYKDVPLEFNLEACRWSNYDKAKVTQSLQSLGFLSLIPRLP